jgi:hypothetical protein
MTRKLDKEHLTAIETLREQFVTNSDALASITIEEYLLEQQRLKLEQAKSDQLKQYTYLRNQEDALLTQLKERYGEGQINITDGTFTPDK